MSTESSKVIEIAIDPQIYIAYISTQKKFNETDNYYALIQQLEIALTVEDQSKEFIEIDAAYLQTQEKKLTDECRTLIGQFEALCRASPHNEEMAIKTKGTIMQTFDACYEYIKAVETERTIDLCADFPESSFDSHAQEKPSQKKKRLISSKHADAQNYIQQCFVGHKCMIEEVIITKKRYLAHVQLACLKAYETLMSYEKPPVIFLKGDYSNNYFYQSYYAMPIRFTGIQSDESGNNILSFSDIDQENENDLETLASELWQYNHIALSQRPLISEQSAALEALVQQHGWSEENKQIARDCELPVSPPE